MRELLLWSIVVQALVTPRAFAQSASESATTPQSAPAPADALPSPAQPPTAAQPPTPAQPPISAPPPSPTPQPQSGAPSQVSLPATTPSAPPAPTPTFAALGSARVRIAADYAGAWLETRPFGSDGEWQRACAAPCGAVLNVDGLEARIVADGMTTTKPFRIQPGSGSALLRVNGGSASARQWGRLGFGIGVPVALIGMAGVGYGTFDDRRGLTIAGAATLGVGAALVLVAIPLLVSGASAVRNDKGDLIAASSGIPLF